ncbi:MAG: hypothetical protein ACN6O2_11895 [Stenotrophomonas sp.]
MKSAKTLLICGLVFITNGIVFLIVGLLTHLSPLWALGPLCIASGITFLAISKARGAKARPSQLAMPDSSLKLMPLGLPAQHRGQVIR